MGYIRERKLKDGGTRYQAEIRLKGHPTLSAMFDRKTDAKNWIQKMEADIRCGRHQLYATGKKHTLKEAIERYFKEQAISVVKRGHLQWWQQELGSLYLQDIRPSRITEKKQKLLTEPTLKGVVRGNSTCNRYLATLSHLMSLCVRQWEWTTENPVKKIMREKEPRERTRFLNADERKRLIEACQQRENSLLTTFVVLLLSTGCRYNEIRNLKWIDIDLTKGRITINQSKNGDKRSVPHDVKLFELLDFQILKSVDNAESRFRNLEDAIRLINPRGRKKGRPLKNEKVSPNIISIPAVFSKVTKKINGKALYLAIDSTLYNFMTDSLRSSLTKLHKVKFDRKRLVVHTVCCSKPNGIRQWTPYRTKF